MSSDGPNVALKPTPSLSFKSSRLVYRGIDKEDLDYFRKAKQDDQAVAQLNPNILLPNSKKSSEEHMKFIEDNALLAAIMCLRPHVSADENAPKITGVHDEKAAEPALIPIGHVVMLKSPHSMAHHRHSEIGISVLKEYRSKGYGSEAIMWILNWGFRMANMHRIYLECFGWNEGAIRLYERLGFKLDGRLREFFWFDGGWHDKLVYSILEEEWKEMQKIAA